VARRSRPIEVAALACVLVLAGALYLRSLHAAANYDEGVYLASVDALEHGQSLGKDVYASQPPGFYVLLRAAGVAVHSVAGFRIAFWIFAVIGLGAAYAIGRKLARSWGAIGAAGLLAVTAPYPVQAARVQADTVSVALALAAVAMLMHARRSIWRAGAAGVLAGAAVSIKLLAFPVVAPIAVLLIGRRSWRQAGAAVAGAVAVWFVLLGLYAGSLSDLWRDAVTDHRRGRSLGPSIADNAHRIFVHPLDWKTPAGVLVPIGLVCAIILLRRLETLALGLWIVASGAFLIYQRPLLDHHLVLIATVLAVPAGAGLGAAAERVPRPARAFVVGVIGLALLAGFAQEERRLAREYGESADVRRAAAELASRTDPKDLVATDLPIVAYLAHRRVPGELVDSSYVRLGTGSLTDREILAVLEGDDVRAVAVGRLFGDRPALLSALRARYPTRIERGGVTLYLASSR
jgi:4-amino-4-deoxy-L-arabinose transferase-like glycosyltransferase